MKFLKSKIFIMFVYCLLTICIAFSGSFLVENFTKFVASAVGSDITENIQGGGGGQPTETDFASTVSEDSDGYDEKKIFNIFGKTGMDNFAKSVNNGCHFAGKTIYLCNDIDYGSIEGDEKTYFDGIGVQIKSEQNRTQTLFKGTFDGQSHTVSNFHLKPNPYYKGYDSEAEDNIGYNLYNLDNLDVSGYGFFAGISYEPPKDDTNESPEDDTKVDICLAKISNLRIKDATYHATNYKYGSGRNLAIGGIVGYVDLTNNKEKVITIENCSVENLILTSEYITENENEKVRKYIGGIAGWGDSDLGLGANSNDRLIINNCYVGEFKSKIHKYPYFADIMNGIAGSNDCAGMFIGTVKNLTISQCVFNYNGSFRAREELSVSDDIKDQFNLNFNTKMFCYPLGLGHDSVKYNGVYYYNPIKNETVNQTAQKESEVDTEFNSLTKSSVGGKNGTPWYYVSDYNGGWPYLRKFISWKELNIKAQDETDITFKIDGNDKTASESIWVPEGYTFLLNDNTQNPLTVCGREIEAVDGVEHTFAYWSYSNYTLTAYASSKLVTLTFSNNDKCEFTGNNEYTIHAGQVIEIMFEEYDKQGCYKSITITFENSEGQDQDVTITYTSKEEYFISQLTVLQGDTLNNITGNTSQEITITQNSVFSVECAEKTYEIKFE